MDNEKLLDDDYEMTDFKLDQKPFDQNLRKMRSHNRKINVLICLVSFLIVMFILLVGSGGWISWKIYPIKDQLIQTLNNVDNFTDSANNIQDKIPEMFNIIDKFKGVDINEWTKDLKSIENIQYKMNHYDVSIGEILNYLKKFEKIIEKYNLSLR